jgi:sialidase-1
MLLAQTHFASVADAAEPLTIFQAGDGGFPCIRVPSLLHVGGPTLLAFAECRSFVGDGCTPTNQSATYPTDTKLRVPCMKRSDDAGATWSALKVVATVRGMYPTTVYAGGRVLLQYATWPHDEPYTEPVVQQVVSADLGTSWSAPAVVAGAPVAYPGGCRGAVAPSGRTFFAGYSHPPRIFAALAAHNYSAFKMRVWYSDDGGDSFVASPDVLQPGAEPAIVAINDSHTHIVARANGALGCACQEAVTSSSGGETWGPVRNVSALPSPGCQGSLLLDEGRLLYSGPDSGTNRTSMSVWASEDGGSWARVAALAPGADASYSCLEATSHAVHVLWETGPTAGTPCTGADCRIVLSTLPR